MNRDYIANFARQTLNKLQEQANKEFGIVKFNIDITSDFNVSRSRSWAYIRDGRFGMTLALAEHLVAARKGLTMKFPEYARIVNDPEIGEIEETTWKKALACLIAHEYAHLIQFEYSRSLVLRNALRKSHNFWEIDSNPHGKQWRWFYRELRRPINLEIGYDLLVNNCLSVTEKLVDGIMIKIFKLGNRIIKTIAEIGGVVLELINGDWSVTEFLNTQQVKTHIEWKINEGII